MMHDCIGGMEEPRYGFVTLIMTNETCEFNRTEGCREVRTFTKREAYVTQHDYQSEYGYTSRQTGEDFAADAPARCRLLRDPSNRCMNYILVARNKAVNMFLVVYSSKCIHNIYIYIYILLLITFYNYTITMFRQDDRTWRKSKIHKYRNKQKGFGC